MSKKDESLKILQILVESAGGSIEPVRDLLCKNNNEAKSKEENSQLEKLHHIAFDGFFHCAACKVMFTDISKIEGFFGRTLEEAYPRVSPTFMKLARTFWTFKLVLNECAPNESVCTALLQDIDIDFAGLFFPFPGPMRQPKKLREKTMRTFIEQSGAELDVEDYIRGNFYLR